MTKDEFDKLLSEALKDNLTFEFSYAHSYGYGERVLKIHVKYKDETVALEEVSIQ